jgi:hypothetical protein
MFKIIMWTPRIQVYGYNRKTVFGRMGKDDPYIHRHPPPFSSIAPSVFDRRRLVA